MATCKDCLHYDVCKIIHFPSMFGLTGDGCDQFKNKADVVPVVRCKDCGMSRETEDERYLFCMNFADTVSSQAFCSYGERKNDNE